MCLNKAICKLLFKMAETREKLVLVDLGVTSMHIRINSALIDI